MNKITIIHYQPIEHYPPIMNTLDFLSKSDKLKINVVTSLSLKRKIIELKKIKINRYPFPVTGESKFKSLLKQLVFNVSAFYILIVTRPDKILYYETYAAFPVYLYSKYINSKAKIFIHFHEYFSSSWYEKGMKMVKYYHQLEINYLFRKANWISHTNNDRLQLFYKDYPFINNQNLKELPNYPPQNWKSFRNLDVIQKPVKVVYVGSLSLGSTYIKEFCEWVLSKQGEVLFDIYCYNSDSFTESYLKKLNSNFISYNANGIEYSELPLILKKYDVGVVLYTALDLNFRYNAPNKLFEYLVCDLDVWFPETMEGILPYLSEEKYPKIIKINFLQLQKFDLSTAIDRTNLSYRKSEYNAESINNSLLQELEN